MLPEPVLDRQRGVVPFAAALERYGDRPAVIGPPQTLTYSQLAARVGEAADRLGTGRKLVLIGASNDVEPLIIYLAALAGGHPVLLASPDRAAQLGALVAAYDPDVVVDRCGGAWQLTERRPSSGRVLHPDLALLLSTSGSTGSPKLVRLSHDNVQANAEAIAAFLDIRASDVAATTLPMHYCYGLSVLHAHLLRGAGLVLSGRSVVDGGFWDDFRAFGATTFAGVPYTFELLDRIGFEAMSLPTLRYVTQAGGRLDPASVRRYAQLGARSGWQLFVMYGQTEATARMAYLPPDLAASYPGAIGVPIPGGSFELDATVGMGDGDGELVYRGPNVMLGYAEQASDLALGRVIDELRTGDIARRNDAGLYEVVGRRSRFVKLFGLRVDLDHAEQVLESHGIPALCAGGDDHLVVAATVGVSHDHVHVLARRDIGLPPSHIRIVELDELPRLANGKPDHDAIRAAAVSTTSSSTDQRTVHGLFAGMLGAPAVADDDTFVGLGGDSLTYVETSIKLEAVLGHLPPDWHTMPVGRLVRTARPARRAPLATGVETNVVLRALAIVLVVAGHAGWFEIRGGAHVLLAIAGFNVARFQVTAARTRGGAGHVVRSIARVAVPGMVWIGLVAVLAGGLRPANVLLVGNYVGAPAGAGLWRYWFLEALVQLMVGVALLLSIPAVRRLERGHGFRLALGLVAVGLLIRFDVLGVDGGTYPRFLPHNVLWLFALGWAVPRASSPGRRLVLSALILVSVPGFFVRSEADLMVLVGLLLLLWVPTVVVPRPLNRAVGLVAGGSLYIYLTHWQVLPLLEHRLPAPVVTLAAVGAGIAAWQVGQRTRRSATTTGPAAEGTILARSTEHEESAMAVPKKKTSKMKSRSRRAANWKLVAPSRSLCPNCDSAKLPHVVCPTCGWYHGRQAVDVD